MAKYDYISNRYEFFDKAGKPRGDFGYYDVVNHNKLRVHYSLGAKYRAIVELTELNDSKFTYARQGKDQNGKPIMVTVEHIPYQGDLAFSNLWN